MNAENGLSPPKAARDGKPYRIGTSLRFRSDSIELRPVKSLPPLPFEPKDPAWPQPEPLRIRPTSHLSPALDKLEGRFPAQFLEKSDSRWSRFTQRFSTSPKPSDLPLPQDQPESRWSQIGNQLTRPLTFRDSVWLSSPENLILQFQFTDEDEAEFFDPPHHIFDRAKKKRLVYLVSLAAVFSPLSSNIYFPALNEIALVCIVRAMINRVQEANTRI
jgi:hypothetical protein